MKAVVVRRFGGPEVLEYVDWPEPAVGPRDVLVRVRAVTVARTLDVEVRRRGADFHVTLPRILGSDPAGVVEAIGPEVTSVAVGDRVVSTSTVFCGRCAACRAGATNMCDEHSVVGVHLDGGYAELCAVPEGTIARIPDHVGFEQAACMGVAYPVAWNLLKDLGGVRPGDDVLVMAAGGGLGVAGTLIAKALGARVIAAAGADWKLERATRELGADAGVDYTRDGWADHVRELSAGGRGVAVAFENISAPALFGGALASLRQGGRLVTCGAHGGGVVEVDTRMLYRRHLTIAGATGATAEQTREVFAAVADGRLAPPPVGRAFALRDAAAAQEAAAGRDLFGRAVLVVEP
jgi:NADPH:quinone reductase-like Zn-dependent oxidoreductase